VAYSGQILMMATILNFTEIYHVVLQMKHGFCAVKDW